MDKQAAKSKKIRRGDRVLAITGNERGQVGVVQRVQGDRVVVQGFNVRKKHIKPTQGQTKGSVVEFEKSIHVSNVRLVGEDDSPIKVKIHQDAEGNRNLVYKNGDQEAIYRPVKQPRG